MNHIVFAATILERAPQRKWNPKMVPRPKCQAIIRCEEHLKVSQAQTHDPH